MAATDDPAPRAVVIIDPAFLGDAVFDAALARAVKTKWPDAHVGLVVRPPADQLDGVLVHVDRVHRFDKRGADRGWSGLNHMASELRDAGYDMALIPHPSIRSTLLARRAGIRRRVGSAPGWLARWALTDVVSVNGGLVQSRLQLLGEVSDVPPLADLLSVERSRGPETELSRVGLVLGSRWATKRWPVHRAVELVQTLDPQTHRFVALGSADERDLYRKLQAELPNHEVEDELGGSIRDLLRALAVCDLVIAGDTGPLHLARGLGRPTIGLFGPTRSDGLGAGPRDRDLVVDVDCRPCSRHGHDLCPRKHHRCLEDLTGVRVGGAVLEALEARR